MKNAGIEIRPISETDLGVRSNDNVVIVKPYWFPRYRELIEILDALLKVERNKRLKQKFIKALITLCKKYKV
jgi:hypothetical protein